MNNSDYSVSRSESLFFFAFVVFLSSPLYAQTDSLVDCFPFAVGNEWVYHYENDIYDGLEFITTSDTGTVDCSIISKNAFADSLVWTVSEQRNFHRHVWIPGTMTFDTTIVDSSVFDVVELRSGAHKLYRQSEIGMNPWSTPIPFTRDVPDSAALFRYHPIDSMFTQTLKRDFGYSYSKIALEVTVKKGIGIIELDGHTDIVSEILEHSHLQLLSQIINGVVTDSRTSLPSAISLSQNYPNPFNPTTRIEYDLPSASHVDLRVYNVLGEEVRLLVNGNLPPGHHVAEFDGSGLPSGVYFCRIQAGSAVGGFTDVKKLLLMK